MDLSRSAKSLATLAGLVVIVLIMAGFGWAQLTKPFPGKLVASLCVDTSVSSGDAIRPGDVTISVLNAGSRSGLARRTMTLFTNAGFAEGDLDNAPVDTEVASSVIWASDPTNPAVQLVRSRLPGKVKVVDMPTTESGVVVVVGDKFTQLVKGKRSIKAKSDTTICSPPSD